MKKSVEQRILDSITFCPNTGCWFWLKYTDKRGYGIIGVGPQPRLAHRVSYETFNGPINSGNDIHHCCRNKCCVNPNHLQQMTHSEHSKLDNVVAVLSSSKTKCPHGHNYSGDNVKLVNKKRICVTCARQRWRDHVHKTKGYLGRKTRPVKEIVF